MSGTDRQPTEEVRQPDPPLPEDSGLTLEEYLAMQQAIGHPTRFRILRTLVDKRQRRTADSQGFYTYYRPTAMGRGILEHGVEALMRREREFTNTYS
jgi:hypothetical protein